MRVLKGDLTHGVSTAQIPLKLSVITLIISRNFNVNTKRVKNPENASNVFLTNLKTQQSTVTLHLRLRKTRSGVNHMVIVMPSLPKSSVVLTFFPFTRTQKARWALSPDSSGLNSVLEKLSFHDGLMWMVGLTVEIKLRSLNSLGNVYATLA